MKKAFGEFRRIARGSLGMSSLWLGSDHLLYVKGSGFLLPFNEEYRRFRYADIHGVVLARTAGLWPGALAYLAGLAIAGGICFALLFFREPGDVGMLATALALPLPVAALMLALLTRHLVLGPRCICEIQTGLRRERLRPVNRLHRGREVVREIADRVRAAQADLAAADPASVTVPTDPLTMGLPGLALPAFGLYLILSGSLLAGVALGQATLAAVTIVLSVAGLVLLLIAQAGSVRHLCPESVRQGLWALLASVLALATLTAVYLTDQAINDPSVTLDLMGPIGALSDIRGRGGLAFHALFLSIGAALFAAAIAGLAVTLRWRGRLTRQQGIIADQTLS